MTPMTTGAEEQRESDARPFQERVADWVLACFGDEIATDELERQDRFLEEVFEALQSRGYAEWRVDAMKRYTFDRPAGEPKQEIGGVMTTLAAWCRVLGFDMHEAAEVELARIWTKVEKIRAKQAAKPKHSPLPVAVPPAGTPGLSPVELDAIEARGNGFAPGDGVNVAARDVSALLAMARASLRQYERYRAGQMREALVYINECFAAAFAEGLNDRLQENYVEAVAVAEDNRDRSIWGLVERRLLAARWKAAEALHQDDAETASPAPQPDAGPEPVAWQCRMLGWKEWHPCAEQWRRDWVLQHGGEVRPLYAAPPAPVPTGEVAKIRSLARHICRWPETDFPEPIRHCVSKLRRLVQIDALVFTAAQPRADAGEVTKEMIEAAVIEANINDSFEAADGGTVFRTEREVMALALRAALAARGGRS